MMHDFTRKVGVLFAHKHPIRLLIATILRKTRLCILFSINCGKYSLRFYPSAFAVALWADPDRRRSAHSFFHDYLRPGDVVIDVGANIGTVTLDSAFIVGESGKVFAIEAHPRTFNFLTKNIQHNHVSNVNAYNTAIGATNGIVSFSNKVNSDDTVNSVMTNPGGIKIEMCRLYVMPIKEHKIALLKIDVEGYEKFVLEGARRITERTDVIYFESGDEHYLKYGYRCSELFKLLIGWGFTLFRINQEKKISLISLDYAANDNILAVRNIESFFKRISFKVEEKAKGSVCL